MSERSTPGPRLSDRWVPVFGSDSRNEEIVNTVTHAAGALLFVVVGVLLIIRAARTDDPPRIVGISVFAVSAVNLYTVSTLYHAVSAIIHGTDRRIVRIFRLLDHIGIYFLITGTYTAVSLAVLPGRWRWIVMGIIWAMAALGVAYKLFFLGRLRFLSVAFYVAMGWLVVIAWGPLVRTAPHGFIFWILLGGVFYTPGTIFLALKKIPYNHAIWHFATIGGTLCHAIGMLIYLVPVA